MVFSTGNIRSIGQTKDIQNEMSNFMLRAETVSLTYTTRRVIDISNNGELESIANGGTGTESDPYIIEGWNITTTGTCIEITGTTVFFIIRNCWLLSHDGLFDFGIYIHNIKSGTCGIINNICQGEIYSIYVVNSNNTLISNNECINSSGGIKTINANGSIIINNWCHDNSNFGIIVDASLNSIITNNTCERHIHDGISLYGSDYSIISNNTCRFNNNGIDIQGTWYSTIEGNTCVNNTYGSGIAIWYSSYSTIRNNLCENNTRFAGLDICYSRYCTVTNNIVNCNLWGIYLKEAGYSEVYNNTIKLNDGKGIWFINTNNSRITFNRIIENNNCQLNIYSGTNNTIHHNWIVIPEGSWWSYARDDGSNNTWYDTETNEGNYWSDYSGEGVYEIHGTAESFDPYPLTLDGSVINEFSNFLIMFPGVIILTIVRRRK